MSEEDHSHEMLVLWLDLQRAIGWARRDQPGKGEILPWNCTDERVQLAWRKITVPENLDALMDRLQVESRKKKRVWTKEAIKECKARQTKGS